MPHFGGFRGTLNCEEILGLTQNSVEGLLTSSGPRMPRDLPGGAGKHCLRGMSGIPCLACCVVWMDWWIINVESSPCSAASSGLESCLVDLQWLVDKSNLSFLKQKRRTCRLWFWKREDLSLLIVIYESKQRILGFFGLWAGQKKQFEDAIFGTKDFNRLIVKKMSRKLDNCQLSNKCQTVS